MQRRDLEGQLIEGSWGKRVYFRELLQTAPLDPATLRQLLVQAGREIDSDFELASLLVRLYDPSEGLVTIDGGE